MPEVQVLDEDLNGLGWTIKSLVDENLEHPEVQRSIKKISGSLVVTEKDSDVTVTLLFRQGELAVRNGAVEKPSATLAGGFEQLSEVISGQIGPVRAVLTGRIKARGNLIKLLAMARALISKDKG
ncbi:MAG: SCP2 sterol-binding domain-containing protein [Desulfomonilaceae bacterium]|nr:SCP2 sterol-binding domain-containing protein [Desulfomonilaceae bacterium]